MVSKCLLGGMFLLALGEALCLSGVSQVTEPTLVPLDASQAIPYFVEDGMGVAGYHKSDRELAKMALNAWSQASGGILKFYEVTRERNAVVNLQWVDPSGGLFGETQQVPLRGKMIATVYVMPDVAQLGEPLSKRATEDALLRDSIVYLTCVHEIGHAVGLRHTRSFEDIMYSFQFGGNLLEYFMRYRRQLQSREDIANHSGLSSNDIQFLHQLYKR